MPRILRSANRRLGHPLDEHDVADVAQDVAVIVLEKAERFVERAPFEAWVHRVCCLELMNGVRRKARGGRVSEVEPEALPEGVEAEACDAEKLHAALDRVGGVEAETIRLKHFDGLTFEELGRRVGISPNTAKARYYRGMLRLQRGLEAESALIR